MLDPETFQRYLQLFPSLTFEKLLPLLALTRERTLQPGDMLIREGESTALVGYVVKGLVRIWQCNERGEERTLSLGYEETVIASHDYILYRQPSRFNSQAMEPTTLLVFSYDEVEAFFATHPELEVLRQYFLMQLMGAAVRRLESFILLTPEERYRQLVALKPGLLQRVPGKHLASMLGITPVSLSRIRSRISKAGH